MNKPAAHHVITTSFETLGIYSPPSIINTYAGKATLYGGTSPSQESNIYAVKSTPHSRYVLSIISRNAGITHRLFKHKNHLFFI